MGNDKSADVPKSDTWRMNGQAFCEALFKSHCLRSGCRSNNALLQAGLKFVLTSLLDKGTLRYGVRASVASFHVNAAPQCRPTVLISPPNPHGCSSCIPRPRRFPVSSFLQVDAWRVSPLLTAVTPLLQRLAPERAILLKKKAPHVGSTTALDNGSSVTVCRRVIPQRTEAYSCGAATEARYATAPAVAASYGRERSKSMAAEFVPSLPPPADLPLQSPLSASVHAAPQVRRPGSVVRMNEVIRHWWAVPAVGFNSILEVPVYRFEIFHAIASAQEDALQKESQEWLAALAHDGALPEEPEEAGCIVLPNDIFGLPIRPDILYRCYWFYRCAIAGWTERMQLYKWEWPGSKRKIRPQCRTGMARLGWRKAPGHYEGVKAHPLRPHDQRKKINKRLLWQGLKIALSAKFAQGQLKVVDHFNLQSHKTKYCVQHLRRLLGRKCPSALLVHEGHSDVNDNFRYATAHILAVRRENVEGVNVYNLLKYRQLVITEKALLKLIYSIQTYPGKRGWLPRYATPDGKPAPVPPKVEGWDREWKEKKEREKQAKYSKALLRERIRRWKWSDETKGAIKIPRVDPFSGFRLARFSLHAPVMPWEKYEETALDLEPLEEHDDEDDFHEAARESLEEQERLERLDYEDLPDAASAAAVAASISTGALSETPGHTGIPSLQACHSNSTSPSCSEKSEESCSDSEVEQEDEDLMEDSNSDDDVAAEHTDWEHLSPIDRYPSGSSESTPSR